MWGGVAGERRRDDPQRLWDAGKWAVRRVTGTMAKVVLLAVLAVGLLVPQVVAAGSAIASVIATITTIIATANDTR